MPTNRWSSEIRSVQQRINDSVTTVIINIGLILQTVGQDLDGLTSFMIEKDHLMLVQDGEDYFIYKVDALDGSQTKIFHALVTSQSFVSKCFMRGKWEENLENWAVRVREVVNETKEKGSND